MSVIERPRELIEKIEQDEVYHDNQLRVLSIRSEICYWIFQMLLVGNIVINSLVSSNKLSDETNRNLEITAACIGACTVFVGYLSRTNFTKKGIMKAISKTYPILKQNLTSALDKDSLEEVQLVFSQVENNIDIVNRLTDINFNVKREPID